MSMDGRSLDALDRALFALPLEEPPADLRSSILLATAYRPVSPFSFWEIAVAGALGAVAVWLVALLVVGGSSLFTHTVHAIVATLAGALSNAATWEWLVAGSATAVWLSLFTFSQPVVARSHRSARENVR
ncbi:MAG TPA: hypothetical protein VHS56_08005 [Candidatus Cybelea sp.]|nr:hypothetical protein [Candidatus Cybelea sp.]